MLGKLTAGVLTAGAIGSGAAAFTGVGAQPLKPGQPAAYQLYTPAPSTSSSIRSGSSHGVWGSSGWGGGSSGGYSGGK